MIKRPVFIMLLAFVLGEIIAVLNGDVIVIAMASLVFVFIIAKRHKVVFVVIFLCLILGYSLFEMESVERDFLYKMPEKEVTAYGVVQKIEQGHDSYRVLLQRVYSEKFSCNKILLMTKEKPAIMPGQTVCVTGVLKQFDMAHNYGNFDLREYYMSLGVYIGMNADTIKSDEGADLIQCYLYKKKLQINNKVEQLLDDNSKGVFNVLRNKSSLYCAILLGERSQMDNDIKSLFQISGISHILAISGLHISFIGLFFYSLMRRHFKFVISSISAFSIVICFGIISGFGIATVRAVVMFGLKLLGEILGKNYDYLTAISVSGLLLLLSNPFVIYNSGFQLSFVAMLAITVVFPMLEELLQVKNKVLKAIVFSFHINFMMAPVIAYHYYELPTYSVILNMIVIPLMGIVIISGIAGISIGFISKIFGKTVFVPGCLVLEGYMYLCGLITKLPYATVIVGKPYLYIIFIYYGLWITYLWLMNKRKNIFEKKESARQQQIPKCGRATESKKEIAKRHKKKMRRYRISSILFMILLISLIYLPLGKERNVTKSDELFVSFLDVGQGDGIFMRTDNGTTVTVDCGSSSVKEVGKNRVIPFLKATCIRQIDYAVMTHADDDHISGLLELLEQSDKNGIKVKNLVLPDIPLKDEAYQNVIKTALEHKVKVRFITCGNILQFGKTMIKCIYPSLNTVATDRNDYSTVLSVKHGDFSMLLTGDISTVPENEIHRYLDNHYTVLKVAHHGSKYSTSSDFLKNISPSFSVISVGANNKYGHPSFELINRLNEAGIKIYRTDERGEITFSTNGEDLSISHYIKEEGSEQPTL